MCYKEFGKIDFFQALWVNTSNELSFEDRIVVKFNLVRRGNIYHSGTDPFKAAA